jgi:hypothetical protein
LLSTTDRSTERGQALALFALAIVVLLGAAAIAFDLGQVLLDRRSEQDGADAAALAGSRYIVEPGCLASPSLINCATAVDEAMRVAYQNGYGAGPTGASNGAVGPNGTTVIVQVPPGPESEFHGQAGYIEVQINRTRASLFAGVLGIFNQSSGALGTASNLTGVALNYSMLSLDDTACPAANFTGKGTIQVAGNIQVDSDGTAKVGCKGAFSANGNFTTITVTAPNGAITVVGPSNCGTATCTPAPTSDSPYVPDPFATLPAPAVPPAPASVMQLGGSSTIPKGCPGDTVSPATAANPATCTFSSSMAGTTWVLSPGYYPGGLSFQAGTFFLRPGLYYIGGGGFTQNGSGASVYSVSSTWSSTSPPATCSTSDFTDCGGVLLYNTNDPFAVSGGTSVKDIQQISLNGSAAKVALYPIQSAGPYTGFVIFQDRDLTVAGTSGGVQLNGNGANLTVVGAIYVPSDTVNISGTGSIGTTQVIADQFNVTGSGTLGLDFNQSVLPQLHAVGLVE